MTSRADLGSDDGETLVEVLVALAILGIAAVAILTGLQLSVKSSDLHRKQATGGAYVRSFAEAIQDHVDDHGYQPCASAASVYGAVPVPGLPPGYARQVTAVRSWNGATWGPCTPDGIQRLDLQVTSPGADPSRRATERLTVIVRQPCNGAATAGSDPCA